MMKRAADMTPEERDAIAARGKAYRQANKDDILAQRKAYYQENRTYL